MQTRVMDVVNAICPTTHLVVDIRVQILNVVLPLVPRLDDLLCILGDCEVEAVNA